MTAGFNLILMDKPRKILYHGHCQQKANFGTDSTSTIFGIYTRESLWKKLKLAAAVWQALLDMKKNIISFLWKLQNWAWRRRFGTADKRTIICASGTSCREQIAHTTERKAIHPLEIFAEALV